MQKERFLTIMAVFDPESQKLFQKIHDDLSELYGKDEHTTMTPYHITLGSYPVEETETIISRIKEVAFATKEISVKFKGFSHFGNVIRFLEPEINDGLLDLHDHFDCDYANGFPGWMPHLTVYRHPMPKEITLPEKITAQLQTLTDSKISSIELGEFFPAKKIVRVDLLK